MKSLGPMAPEERRAGQRFNALKNTVAELIDARKVVLENAGIDARLIEERIDVTLPLDLKRRGHSPYQPDYR